MHAPAAKAAAGREKTVSETIRLKLVEHGEYEVELFRDAYERAKATGNLDHLLDAEMSNIPTDSWIIEPDGTEVHPYG